MAESISKTAKVTLIAVSLIVAVLAVGYGVAAYFFSTHFFPNTSVGDKDVSLQSNSEFADDLALLLSTYTLDINGYDFKQVITRRQAGIDINPQQVSKRATESQNYLAWPVEIFKPHDLSSILHTGFDQVAVDKMVKKAVEKHNKTAKLPEDAFIAFDKVANRMAIVQETYGSKIDVRKLLPQVHEALTNLEREYQIKQDDLIQPTIYSTDERLTGAVGKANGFMEGEIELKLTKNVNAHVVTPELISSWIVFDPKTFNPSLDERLIAEWATELGQSLNTVGTERTYKRPDGKKITVSGGTYGWTVDASSLTDELIDQLKKGKFKAITLPVTQEAGAFNGAGKRDWTSWVDVDISQQHARYYDENDKLLFEFDFVSGLPSAERSTPLGIYSVNGKGSPETLIGRDSKGKVTYRSEVTYWIPFIRNAIGFHDASWRPERSNYGGNIYEYNGSHGCVNVYIDDAKWLYENLPEGTCVVVHE